MSSKPDYSVINDLFRDSWQAAESNLRLQQDLWRGWSHYWPGFTGRQPPGDDGSPDLRKGWPQKWLESARAHHEMLTRQFDAGIAALDATIGAMTESPTEDAAAAAAAPPAAPVAEKAPEPSPPVSKPAPPPVSADAATEEELPLGASRNIYQKVAVVTGAASGIGEAVARELARRGAKAVVLVDRSDDVEALSKDINASAGRAVAEPMVGDTTDEAFRKRVFNMATEKYGLVSICIPAAGITRDALSVKIDKETGHAELYPLETFRQVTEVNLLAPIYWGIEMVARIAEDRRRRGLKRWEPEEKIQGTVVFLGSVSSQGNKGQISYAVAKAGLEGAAATLTKEAIFHGVRCGIIHPGFTDTPMARALGEDFLKKNVLPYTQLRRLIRPDEIADAICFMVSNAAVSGELWADAGWHPPA